MAQTPNSSATSYCSAALAAAYVDVRRIGQLCDDTGTALTATQLLTDTTWAELLKAASGEVESACVAGERYSPTDLAALTGVSAALLRRMVALRASWLATLRRLPEADMTGVQKWADEQLEALRNGSRVFAFEEAEDAGHQSLVQREAGDEQDLNRTVTRAGRFFGDRTNRS